MHHHFPFPGGQNREDGIQAGRESLHLSSGISGLRMREGEPGKGDYHQADFAEKGRASGKSKSQKREAQDFSESGHRQIICPSQ